MASLVQHRLPNSKWFYGRIKNGGKFKSIPLDVQVKGTPPKYRGDKGDEAYQHSKWEAEKRLEPLLKEIENLSFPEATKAIKRFGEMMKESKRGNDNENPSKYILADELADEWLKLPRRGAKARVGGSSNDARSHGAQVVSKVRTFISFCKKRKRKLKYAFEVDKEDAEAFIRSQWERGCTGTTCNKQIINLKSVFTRLKDRIGYTENPFNDIELFPKDTISRKAFTDKQVALIYEFGMKDLYGVGGIILAGLFTGMREGDCCTLRWKEVDLNAGKIKVTAEPVTGERTALKTSEKIWIPMFPPFRNALIQIKPKQTGYIFPGMAQKYRAAPDSISRRLVRAIENVFSGDESFERSIEREHGLRKASVYDFAALRTTWITLAVESGVPTAEICLVSGHTSEAMLLKHYLKPDRQSLQRSFENKMVALAKLGDSQNDPQVGLVRDLQDLKGMLQDEDWRAITTKSDWAIRALERAIEKIR